MSQLETFWYDQYAYECYPNNPRRPKPEWLIELVRKSDYDKLIDIMRSKGLDCPQGGAYGDRASDSGPGDETSGAI